MAEPHPSNTPGPFYVAQGACTGCGIPVEMASELFARDPCPAPGGARCYVRTQPCTPELLRLMVTVIRTAEQDCIRYRGGDPATEAELDRQNLMHLNDSAAGMTSIPKAG